MKHLFILIFGFSSAAMAMPEGDFSCATKDKKNQMTFEIVNYGTNWLKDISDLEVDGTQIGTTAEGVGVGRQFVDIDMAYFDVNLPPGDYFSKKVVIKTEAKDHIMNKYEGTMTTQIQKDDYMDRYVVIKSEKITCTWSP